MKELSNHALRDLHDHALIAATKAGQLIQQKHKEEFNPLEKNSGTSKASKIVTEVDFEVQSLIIKELHQSIIKYDLGLLTEESADDQSRFQKQYFWCIDPIDGTLAFAERRSGYAVSIALISRAGQVLLGVCTIPDKNESFSAIKGQGSFRNNLAFSVNSHKTDNLLNVFIDESLREKDFYTTIEKELLAFGHEVNLEVKFHTGFGAVRNALSVLTSHNGCYFKLSREQKGGGSIWDFAATHLIFTESKLISENAYGKNLHFNDPATSFMHKQGVLYATHNQLRQKIIAFNDKYGR